jgi:hypothetical protein
MRALVGGEREQPANLLDHRPLTFLLQGGFLRFL